MQNRERLNSLIDRAASIYGSDGKLAAAMSTTRQTLSNWRHGHKEPSTEVQAKLAEIAGLDIGMHVAAAAIEKTGNEQAMQWLETQMAKIRNL